MIFYAAMLAFFSTWATPTLETSPQPIELGNVTWGRHLDQALQQSQNQDKPVFILFQEIPGCSTCRNYGQHILTDPFIVEAIESLFIPVAIYNNQQGKDAEVLALFGEPSWNNPVVRIVNPLRADLSPRLSGDYSKLGIVQSMVTALETVGKPVPPYLTFLSEFLSAQQVGPESAVFSMYCFWSGEKGFGQMPGLVASDPGFMGGREVVKVDYHPELISYREVLQFARDQQISAHVFTLDAKQEKAAKALKGMSSSAASGYRQDHTPKYYLAQTNYRYIPMLYAMMKKPTHK